jgi:hypothetical protein
MKHKKRGGYKMHKPCLTYAQAMKRFYNYTFSQGQPNTDAIKLGYFMALVEFGHLRYGVFPKVRSEIKI